ncbi:hypothetical protein ABZ930_10545 [Streptomyces sp. NPDC046716]|uniref:hypothetical protein n=1 Tax=Streptomyces sp. NPDC046716 TaxID=3157093 RepID=UPI003405F7EB
MECDADGDAERDGAVVLGLGDGLALRLGVGDAVVGVTDGVGVDAEGSAALVVGDALGALVVGEADAGRTADDGVLSAAVATSPPSPPEVTRTVTSAATLSTPATAVISSTGARRPRGPESPSMSSSGTATGRSARAGRGGCAYGSGTRGGGGWEGSGRVMYGRTRSGLKSAASASTAFRSPEPSGPSE